MGGADSKAAEESFDLALFREPERTRRDLARVRAHAPAGLLQDLPFLLADSPDPDQAVRLLERFISGDGEWIARLHREPRLLRYALVVFGHSYWLGETLLRHPEILDDIRQEKNLELTLSHEAYRERLVLFRSRICHEDIARDLAAFRKREYVRIALRDCLGLAGLAETTEEISALSDVAIEAALHEAESHISRRFGCPEYCDGWGRRGEETGTFAVLSLGKLGGKELNYSSDLDLLYIYSAPEGASPLREYFIRQAQWLTEVLSRATPEGAVFRIDLRLRPQGSEGEPAISLRRALDYYAHLAHDWELQALIKARYSAGDMKLANAFIDGVQRYVYTDNVNFEAIETAMHSRQRIGARRRRIGAGRKEPDSVDVKLDRGGIRDIEFLAQCLQRAYGGEERWLRSGGTLFSLQKLHDKGHLRGADFHELADAYRFLRKVEHRLQLQRGQQLHVLPRDTSSLKVLQRAVDPGLPDARAFLSTLRAHMMRVTEIYERVLHSERYGRATRHAAPGEVRSAVNVREMTLDQILQRIAVESPTLHDVIARADLDLHTRRNLSRFLSSALTSAERYAPLLENPSAVGRAITLLGSSDYLSDILVRHPDVIRNLTNTQDQDDILEEKRFLEDLRFAREERDDTNAAMVLLRRDFRRLAFTAGAQDVLSPRSAFVSMREITNAGDVAIRHALKAVQRGQSLAVFALGRLGTGEFDIASDADLLFVRAPESDEDEARLDAEQLVRSLSSYTKEGVVFAVDTRLRPRGGAGDLVMTPAQVERYLSDEAQAWEALTYTKLRFVSGKEDLAPLVVTSTRHQIMEIAAKPGFAEAVKEMRARLDRSNRYPRSFKLARGGFYDIDFIASFLMLRHGSLPPGNTLDRLRHLRSIDALDDCSCEELSRAGLLYRTADHVVRLVTGRGRPELPQAENARRTVGKLAERILGRDAGDDLQAQLDDTALRVREIFDVVFST